MIRLRHVRSVYLEEFELDSHNLAHQLKFSWNHYLSTRLRSPVEDTENLAHRTLLHDLGRI